MAWFDCCWSGWWCRFNGNTCYIVFSFCFALDQMGNPLVLHGVSYMVIEPKTSPEPQRTCQRCHKRSFQDWNTKEDDLVSKNHKRIDSAKEMKVKPFPFQRLKTHGSRILLPFSSYSLFFIIILLNWKQLWSQKTQLEHLRPDCDLYF